MADKLLHTPYSRRLIALGLIALGVLIMLGQLWPLFIILPGLGLLAVYHVWETQAAAVFALAGVLTGGTGFILLFQNITGYWESWAYAWTLYGVFIGGGLVMMADRLREPTLARVGRTLTLISFVIFLMLGGVVTLLQFASLRVLVMLILVGLGSYLLLVDRKRLPAETPKTVHVPMEEGERRIV